MKFEFGDIVENLHASERNPIRKGVFVRHCISQKTNCVELTDMNGHFWKVVNDHRSQLFVIGNVIDKFRASLCCHEKQQNKNIRSTIDKSLESIRPDFEGDDLNDLENFEGDSL